MITAFGRDSVFRLPAWSFQLGGNSFPDLAALADGLLWAAELGNGAYSQLDRCEWFPGPKVN